MNYRKNRKKYLMKSSETQRKNKNGSSIKSNYFPFLLIILTLDRFKTFDMENKQIGEILSLWDRAHPPIRPSLLSGDHGDNPDENAATTSKRAGKSTTNPKKGKELVAPQNHQISISLHSPSQDESGENSAEVASGQEELPGVPNVVIDISKKSKIERDKIIQATLDIELPTVEEVMEGLGIGPKGPPIPPPAIFSIVKYPMKRRAPNLPEMLGENGHYNLLGTVEDKDDEKLLKDILEKEEEKRSDKVYYN